MLTQALKARKARLADEKGFTLIELLAVIVILAIIAVIAIPLIGNVIDNSKEDGDIATARQIYDAARLYVIGEEDGVFVDAEVRLQDLQTNGYIENGIVLPSSKVPLVGDTTIVLFDADGALNSVTLSEPPHGRDNGLINAPEIIGNETE
ncbi:prepilin-type N-terminal cleavage/methylation domain-containing protein [Paenibacillus gallinarum]|uniref:Prepilin-type N-terminal cleavage/methylation domain-containing protein n=1 Tax=Paenibacillus gallinarum TaxID=2762232 RepID=A0ABR8SW05_9BACL|nr:prepilin-type N-terminal cleavage/methylation domain-containing protein [Paenibacillus gallinarum]MBD7967691.1 prepilin-type N-terminal cleavage/methylation domain-containing protein [Paenibacillus gallinarum]